MNYTFNKRFTNKYFLHAFLYNGLRKSFTFAYEPFTQKDSNNTLELLEHYHKHLMHRYLFRLYCLFYVILGMVFVVSWVRWVLAFFLGGQCPSLGFLTMVVPIKYVFYIISGYSRRNEIYILFVFVVNFDPLV